MTRYAEHVAAIQQRWEAALAANRFDAAVIAAGARQNYFLDDQAPPFRANPHFAQWFDATGCEHALLLVRPGRKPTLFFHQQRDYWHQPPTPPETSGAIDVQVFDSLDGLVDSASRALQNQNRTALIGDSSIDRTNLSVAEVNPQQLLNRLHYGRAYKTDFEIDCMKRATEIGVHGHRAALAAYRAGASEYDIHQAYLLASKQNETELPYSNIVAQNEHAGVLHYQHYDREPPRRRASFLIDAGGRYGGYASDITRTYAADEQSDFAALVAAMDARQQALIASIKPGLNYLDLHEDMHRAIGDLLAEFELVDCSGAEAFESHITDAFIPHGLGHLIGLQTHDVAGHMVSPDGGTRPPPDRYAALRLTRDIAVDQIFTIEPGLYFIPMLLDELRSKPAAKRVNWPGVARFMQYGGIRIEDNVHVTRDGVVNLTRDAFAAAENEVTRLTVERLFGSPSLNGGVPTHVRFSPDGQFVTYLANPPEDRERLDLYAYEVATGASNRLIDASRIHATGEPTAAEKVERERRRQFSAGLSGYRWLPDGKRICSMLDGAVYVFDCESASLRAITGEGLRQTDLTVSPRGRYLSYVRAGELYLYDLALAREDRLTHDASDCVTNGLAEFVAQEEMHRFEGHWWSPDDAHVVFARVDNSSIAETHRYEFTASELVAVAQRYPYAGAANAKVDLYVIDLQTHARRAIEYRQRPDDYLARVNVAADCTVVQVQSRDQRALTLTAFPFDGGAPREVLTEQQPAWINLHDNFRFVGTGTDFLWTSERSGASHLYLYRADGASRPLTHGKGRINEVVHADATHAFVLGWTERPTEQHLLRVALDGAGEPEVLTKAPGWHEAVVDPTGAWFVDRYSNIGQPACLELHSLAETSPRRLAPNALVEGHPYFPYVADHAEPSFGHFAAADGQALWYRLTLPHGHDAKTRIPVLVNVYGGPGVQRVRNEWAPLANQLFANLGIAVFELDNRGGGNRAKSFEDPISGRLGCVEVDDQLAGIDFIKQQPWADPERIGVIGHSYGGFMTLMLMARNDGRIRCGVSTAPVTDWRLYDTHYTERYLSTPQLNGDGYRESCVLSHVDAISGALLLMHGMADDNVLFANSSALMKALQNRGFPFELMLYPGAKHAMQERDVSIHRYQTILDFLQRKLIS